MCSKVLCYHRLDNEGKVLNFGFARNHEGKVESIMKDKPFEPLSMLIDSGNLKWHPFKVHWGMD